ncbi:MAG TPA: glycoside hydrolase family 32 protein [Puia sp.]|jgi:fructan beta-fructosidase
MHITGKLLAVLLAILLETNLQGQSPALYHEPFRPQIHFSPKEKWINDPNGLVFFGGTYHLFFQYYPHDIVWGPMHWGHATSKDRLHWQQQPIALYPDSLGYIFSGCVVVDSNNTSGLGRDGKIPLVAVFTQHDPAGEKNGSNRFQNQSLAYSPDSGVTWIKYQGNPVLKNPGITDFRDPNVFWYLPAKKWVMSLATKDRITFYSSTDLKDWKKESEFGQDAGAHGGVWECPNLFPIAGPGGKLYWALLVSTNPGGPNGGSGTQYFIGEFDGHSFHPSDPKSTTKWLDYGPDDYAGITWDNPHGRRIFIGWMSNWLYANQVPTKTWRNAMTLPRALALRRTEGSLWLVSEPIGNLDHLRKTAIDRSNIRVKASPELSAGYTLHTEGKPYRLHLAMTGDSSFSIVLSNSRGEQVVVGYDKDNHRYYIDRSHSGVTDFNTAFATRPSFAPRIGAYKKVLLTLVVDVSSLELFADGGLTVMSAIFFPEHPFTDLRIVSPRGTTIDNLSYWELRSIW